MAGGPEHWVLDDPLPMNWGEPRTFQEKLALLPTLPSYFRPLNFECQGVGVVPSLSYLPVAQVVCWLNTEPSALSDRQPWLRWVCSLSWGRGK